MGKSFEIIRKDSQVGIKCLRCNLTSWNPYDVIHHFCGNCKRFHRQFHGVDELAHPQKMYTLLEIEAYLDWSWRAGRTTYDAISHLSHEEIARISREYFPLDGGTDA